MTKILLCLSFACVVAGCIAPEEPAPLRNSARPQARPIAAGVTYDDAPLPNRKLGAPASDSVIRLAK